MTAVVLYDVAYLLITIIMHLLIFFILHVIVLRLRLFNEKKLVTTISCLIAIAGIITLLITFFVLKGLYSSLATYAVATTGAIIASVFILGFYGFSGPVCVDRSPSTHMAFVLMENLEHGLSRDELREKYGYEKVFDRRIMDFLDAHFAVEKDGKLFLTRKGCRFTSYYLFMQKLLNLPRNY